MPPEITDPLLDGGTGKVYHWSDISGWSFHRLWPEWDGSV
ncbi:MAG: hypothetical protein JWM23_210 [Microbacteriaceae bacterium]|nr:hypothetical protein [Microbacteriaceae bacterium]